MNVSSTARLPSYLYRPRIFVFVAVRRVGDASVVQA
jgi:hypothetical protein